MINDFNIMALFGGYLVNLMNSACVQAQKAYSLGISETGASHSWVTPAGLQNFVLTVSISITSHIVRPLT
jgi:hypothetical protein